MRISQLLLLIAFVCFASANPLQSTKPSSVNHPECAKGSTFWCQNVRTAKRCNAVDFCIQAVWESHKAQTDSNVICDDCKEWVGQARSFIEKKDKSGEVINTLKWTCDLIPLISIAESCEKIVDENIPEILKMLESKMDPDAVCSALYFCNNFEYKKALMDQSSGKLLPFTCGQCQHIGAIVEQKFSQAEQDDILENILGMCGEMSSFSDSCSSIVLTHFDDIYSGLKKNIKKQNLCTLSASCANFNSRREGIVDIVPPRVDADPNITCQLCEQLALHLRELLITNTTEIEFKNIMTGFCHQMGQFSDECIQLTDQYYETIYKFVVDKLNANKMCKSIGICPSQLSDRKIQLPTMPLVSSDVFPAPKTIQTFPHEVAVTPSHSIPKETPTCQFCLFAIQEVRDIIESNSTKQSIQNAMSKLCNHLSVKLMSQCTEFVKDYTDEVVEMLLANFSPQEACTFIKLCNDSKVEYKNAKIVQIEPDFDDDSESKELVMNPQCELCKEIVKLVEERVINKQSKDEIRRELEKSCERLKKFSDKCIKFVDKYSDQIVELIEKELEPQEVCRELIFCVAQDDIESQDYDSGWDILKMAVKKPADEIKEQPQCVVCEIVMTKLEDELNDKTVDINIKNTVRNICSKLPATISKSCKKFIDYYFDMIIVLIETMKPSEICGEMKLCPAKTYSEVMLRQMVQSDIYECAVCKGLVQGIDSVIEDPYADTNLENLEEKLCMKFAGQYKDKCHEIAKNYGLLIINLIKNLTDSDQICYKLDLCALNADGVSGMVKLT